MTASGTGPASGSGPRGPPVVLGPVEAASSAPTADERCMDMIISKGHAILEEAQRIKEERSASFPPELTDVELDIKEEVVEPIHQDSESLLDFHSARSDEEDIHTEYLDFDVELDESSIAGSATESAGTDRSVSDTEVISDVDDVFQQVNEGTLDLEEFNAFVMNEVLGSSDDETVYPAEETPAKIAEGPTAPMEGGKWPKGTPKFIKEHWQRYEEAIEERGLTQLEAMSEYREHEAK